MSAYAGPEITNSGLVLALDAANSKSYPGSGTNWTDLSGNGNNGTLTNTTYSQDPTVLNFSSSECNLGQKFNFTSESFSISFWTYMNSYPTTAPLVFLKGGYQVNGYYGQIYNTGLFNFVTNQSGAAQGTAATNAIPLSVWRNIVVTRSGSSAIIYVNGVNATTTSGTHINPASSTNNFWIGSYGGGGYADMKLANFSIYNRALTAAEIQQNFNSIRGRFGI